MSHSPRNPRVQAAYAALCTETLAQWHFIQATGLVVEFAPTEQPYPNPRMAILDITQNNRFFVTPMLTNFGNSSLNPTSPSNPDLNPLLQLSAEQFSGRPALINDIFRVVHDYFGHCKEGLGFQAAGEENAWRGHAVMYSALAREAKRKRRTDR